MTENDIIDVSDLEITQPLSPLPMSKDEVIELINETLEDEKWTLKDRADGREVEVFPEWKSFIGEVVWDYKMAGWDLYHFVDGGREYLSFTDPNKKMFNV